MNMHMRIHTHHIQVPAVYATPRPDTVTICVGVAGHDSKSGPPTVDIPGAEYDFLEFLYAKDQDSNDMVLY